MRNRNGNARARVVENAAVAPRRTKFADPAFFQDTAETVHWTDVPANELAPEPLYPQTSRLLPAGSAARKNFPITTGFIDYFPDAIAAVAEVSFIGNQKHNPGEPMHWSRGKSNDHADCVGRHLQERGTWDTSGSVKVRHSAQLAWRSMALLQEELELEAGLALPRGAKARAAT